MPFSLINHAEHQRAFINTSSQPQATSEAVISADGVTPPAAAATSTSSAPSTGQAASGE